MLLKVAQLRLYFHDTHMLLLGGFIRNIFCQAGLQEAAKSAGRPFGARNTPMFFSPSVE
jgi:hypothetical protein